MAPTQRSTSKTVSAALRHVAATAAVAAFLLGSAAPSHARSSDMRAAWNAYSRNDYIRTAALLSPLAQHGNAKAQALLGFLYENGFGVPQAYDVAADLYRRASIQGNPDAQCRLGLLYDKGHGVPQDTILAYKWLDLAAAHATRREREYYLRLRNAVASKMTADQISEGQHLALIWLPQRW